VLAKKQGGLAGEQFYGCLGSSGKVRRLAFVSEDPGAQVASIDDDTTTYVVRAFDGRTVRTLARGGRIGRNSLKLSGSTVSWTDGGARKSATL
jgi:hypothetical protein